MDGFMTTMAIASFVFVLLCPVWWLELIGMYCTVQYLVWASD